jgi:hypothetical protein
MTLEMIGESTARIDGAATIESLRAALGEHELLVEPLSARQPLAAFIAEGGLGWGSLREGTFGASICRVKTSRFEYGSDHQALYNVGYPLHRLVEGGGADADDDLGEIQDLTVYVRPVRRRVAVFEEAAAGPIIEAPGEALDAFYVNEAAAGWFGLAKNGWITVHEEDAATGHGGATIVEGLWDRRFFMDRLPAAAAVAKVLTQPSASGAALEAAAGSGVGVVGLIVQLGMLVVVAGETGAVKRVSESLTQTPLSWALGARA